MNPSQSEKAGDEKRKNAREPDVAADVLKALVYIRAQIYPASVKPLRRKDPNNHNAILTISFPPPRPFLNLDQPKYRKNVATICLQHAVSHYMSSTYGCSRRLPSSSQKQHLAPTVALIIAIMDFIEIV